MNHIDTPRSLDVLTIIVQLKSQFLKEKKKKTRATS